MALSPNVVTDYHLSMPHYWSSLADRPQGALDEMQTFACYMREPNKVVVGAPKGDDDRLRAEIRRRHPTDNKNMVETQLYQMEQEKKKASKRERQRLMHIRNSRADRHAEVVDSFTNAPRLYDREGNPVSLGLETRRWLAVNQPVALKKWDALLAQGQMVEQAQHLKISESHFEEAVARLEEKDAARREAEKESARLQRLAEGERARAATARDERSNRHRERTNDLFVARHEDMVAKRHGRDRRREAVSAERQAEAVARRERRQAAQSAASDRLAGQQEALDKKAAALKQGIDSKLDAHANRVLEKRKVTAANAEAAHRASVIRIAEKAETEASRRQERQEKALERDRAAADRREELESERRRQATVAAKHRQAVQSERENIVEKRLTNGVAAVVEQNKSLSSARDRRGILNEGVATKAANERETHARLAHGRRMGSEEATSEELPAMTITNEGITSVVMSNLGTASPSPVLSPRLSTSFIPGGSQAPSPRAAPALKSPSSASFMMRSSSREIVRQTSESNLAASPAAASPIPEALRRQQQEQSPPQPPERVRTAPSSTLKYELMEAQFTADVASMEEKDKIAVEVTKRRGEMLNEKCQVVSARCGESRSEKVKKATMAKIEAGMAKLEEKDQRQREMAERREAESNARKDRSAAESSPRVAREREPTRPEKVRVPNPPPRPALGTTDARVAAANRRAAALEEARKAGIREKAAAMESRRTAAETEQKRHTKEINAKTRRALEDEETRHDVCATSMEDLFETRRRRVQKKSHESVADACARKAALNDGLAEKFRSKNEAKAAKFAANRQKQLIEHQEHLEEHFRAHEEANSSRFRLEARAPLEFVHHRRVSVMTDQDVE